MHTSHNVGNIKMFYNIKTVIIVPAKPGTTIITFTDEVTEDQELLEQLAQGHTALKEESRNLNLGILVTKPTLFTILLHAKTKKVKYCY